MLQWMRMVTVFCVLGLVVQSAAEEPKGHRRKLIPPIAPRSRGILCRELLRTRSADEAMHLAMDELGTKRYDGVNFVCVDVVDECGTKSLIRVGLEITCTKPLFEVVSIKALAVGIGIIFNKVRIEVAN